MIKTLVRKKYSVYENYQLAEVHLLKMKHAQQQNFTASVNWLNLYERFIPELHNKEVMLYLFHNYILQAY